MKFPLRYFTLILGAICCNAQFHSASNSNEGDNVDPHFVYNYGPLSRILESFLGNCRKNLGEASASSYKQAVTTATKCLEAAVNTRAVHTEFLQDKNNGDLKKFFKKYCRKELQLKQCLINFSHDVNPCFTLDKKEIKLSLFKISQSLLDFICYNEGTHFAAFLADGGAECLHQNAEFFGTCSQTSAYPYISMLMYNPNSVKYLFNKPQCLSFADFLECSMEVVKTCEKPSITNFLDEFINTVKKSSPCEKYYSGNGSEGLRKSLFQTATTVSIAFILTLFF